MRTKVSRLIMYGNENGLDWRPHNLVPFVEATEEKKIFAPSSSQYSSIQSLPFTLSPAWGRELLVVIDSLKTTLGLSPQ